MATIQTKGHTGQVTKSNGAVSGLITVIVAGILIALIAFWGFSKPKTELTKTEPQINQPAPSAWKTYQNTKYGFSFMYPATLTVTLLPAKVEKGDQLCLAFSKATSPESGNPAQPVSAPCTFKDFGLGGPSWDYQAETEGGFTDQKGYGTESGKVYLNFSPKYEIPAEAIKKIYKNSNGIELVIVDGRNSETTGLAMVGTPGEGYLGAIVNINKTLPGLNFVFSKTTNLLTEQDFYKILASLKIWAPNTTSPTIGPVDSEPQRPMLDLTTQPPKTWISGTACGINFRKDPIFQIKAMSNHPDSCGFTVVFSPPEPLKLGHYFYVYVYYDYDGGSRRQFYLKKHPFSSLTYVTGDPMAYIGATDFIAGKNKGLLMDWVDADGGDGMRGQSVFLIAKDSKTLIEIKTEESYSDAKTYDIGSVETYTMFLTGLETR